MNPVVGNPLFLEYSLCKEFGWEPQTFEDQNITLPPFKEVLKWFLGKPLNILVKRGLDATKVDKFLAILDEIRVEQEEIKRRMESEAKLRGEKI